MKHPRIAIHSESQVTVSLPELIVFDLDFTLWDCGGTWCDCTTPPYREDRGKVLDKTGRYIVLYDDVLKILDFCDEKTIPTALASRTEQPSWARQLIDLLGIADRFALSEIYPSSKLKHFAALQQSSGIDYEAMLFFDDEMRNIREVSKLGVTSIFVEDGLSLSSFNDGLSRHADVQR